jgi:hypothetical protein
MSRPADGRAGGPAGSRVTLATTAANLLAGILLGVAFVSVRNEASLARQVGGLELAGLAAILAVGADLGHIVATYRAVVTSRRRLSGTTGPTTGVDSSIRASAVLPTVPLPSVASLPVALPSGTLVHHPACALVGGKNAEALSPEVIAGRGLRPCPVCRP